MKGYSPIMAVQSMTGVSTRLAYSRERSNQKKKEQEKENKGYKSFGLSLVNIINHPAIDTVLIKIPLIDSW